MGLNLNKINRALQEIPAKKLNLAYDLFSDIYKRSRGSVMEHFMPRLLATQKEIEEKAARKLAQVLSVIKIAYLKQSGESSLLQSVKQRQEYRRKLTFNLLAMLAVGELERHGTSIFLHGNDIQPLAKLIEVDEQFFQKKAENLKIVSSIIDDPSKLSYLRNEAVVFGEEQYTCQYYRVITKDGAVNELTMLIDETQVIAGDNKPSVILVPGIACNSNAFNLNQRYSFARDLARRGYWVYLFEPRGMGRNKIGFDVDCTIDTLIDYDLPAVVDFIHKRSKGKPVILLGHSMGGVICEFMLQLWAKQNDHESLAKIKSLITLGFPGTFNRNRHIAYPLLLWLNYLLPFLKVDRVPLDDLLFPLCKTPGLKTLFKYIIGSDVIDMNIFINPANFTDSKFMSEFAQYASETFPLGIGFQFQKAIYSGKGISRMDNQFGEQGETYNYTANIGFFPPNVPAFHFLGEYDILAPPGINNFSGDYRHSTQHTIFLETCPNFEITREPSQLLYFIVPATKHIDLLYGKTAEMFICPTLFEIIDTIW